MDRQAELVSIGTELLSGRTVNTHARDLGARLGEIGIRLVRDTTVPDEPEVIRQVVREALERVPLAFVSGGLGPTSDDCTREALADLFGRDIREDAASVERIAARCAERGREMTEVDRRQARVIDGAVVLPNPAGAAPGQRLEWEDGRCLFVLPGPPAEFNALLEKEIIPWLRVTGRSGVPAEVRVLRTAGIAEAQIVTLLEKEGFSAPGVTIGFYPAPGRVEIRLTAPSARKDALDRAFSRLQSLLEKFLDA